MSYPLSILCFYTIFSNKHPCFLNVSTRCPGPPGAVLIAAPRRSGETGQLSQQRRFANLPLLKETPGILLGKSEKSLGSGWMRNFGEKNKKRNWMKLDYGQWALRIGKSSSWNPWKLCSTASKPCLTKDERNHTVPQKGRFDIIIYHTPLRETSMRMREERWYVPILNILVAVYLQDFQRDIEFCMRPGNGHFEALSDDSHVQV